MLDQFGAVSSKEVVEHVEDPSTLASKGRAQRWYQAAPQNAVDNRRRIPAETLEAVVRDQMNEEVDSHEFTQRFVAELRRAADALPAERDAAARARRADRERGARSSYAPRSPRHDPRRSARHVEHVDGGRPDGRGAARGDGAAGGADRVRPGDWRRALCT